jgi:hypothetical protein
MGAGLHDVAEARDADLIVVELIAKRGRAIVEARSVVILLQDGDDLVVAVGAGYSQAQVGLRIPVGESTSGRCRSRPGR